jgi:hypothetical protein
MEPRARLVLATFLVTLAVGVGTGWAVGRKTLPARPVALPTPAEPLVEPPTSSVAEPPPHLQALVLDLTSNEAATWREAAVRLAFSRPFPAKAVGAIDTPEHRVRVLKVLDAALAQCLPLDEVMQVAPLGRLLAPSLATARHHFSIDLLGVSHDVGTLQSASEGGVAVGVALQALRSSDPRQVVKGLRALERMKPACARERVRSLLTTNTLVSTGMTQVRLGEAADQTLRALPSRTTPLAGLEELLLRDRPPRLARVVDVERSRHAPLGRHLEGPHQRVPPLHRDAAPAPAWALGDARDRPGDGAVQSDDPLRPGDERAPALRHRG